MSWVLQSARGVCLAALIGVALFAGAMMVGLVDGTSLLLFPAAAVPAITYALVPDVSRRAQAGGATAFGVLSAGFGLVSGFGTLEVSGIVGAVVAAVVIASAPTWETRLPVASLAVAALAVVVANLVPFILDGGGLNHDESAYALKARHWFEGTPETGWNLHRGIAMSGYGYLVLQSGGDEPALRLLGLAAIVGLAAATWVLGHRIGGKWVGVLSAIAVLCGPSLLRRSTEYLSDVPSSALLMACMIVVWWQFAERDKPGYGLLWLLPFALGAFYIRYQSVLSFALIAVMLVVLFRDEVKGGWRPVALTGLLGLAGLIPHFEFAVSETGSPLGVLLFTADVAGREFYGEGLIDYFLFMGWPLAAYVGPIATLVFVWWLVADWSSLENRTKALFLMIPAAGQVLILGLLSHGEERFIFFPVALTIVGGITGLFSLSKGWRPEIARAARFVLAIILVGSLAMTLSYVRGSVESRRLATVPIELAAEEIRDLSGTTSCGVMTSYLPQITYYSACVTAPFRTHLEPIDALSRIDGDSRFMLMVEDGKRQPTGEDLDDLLAVTAGEPHVLVGDVGYAEVYRFDP